MSLVADYGSSEEEEEKKSDCSPHTKTLVNFSSLENSCITGQKAKGFAPNKKLDNPFKKSSNGVLADIPSSVFYNPFLRSEEAKTAVLEQHVKLTDNHRDLSEINGVKICWNFRKGHCKFGSKCLYAHDTDLLVKHNPYASLGGEAPPVFEPDYEIHSESSIDQKGKRKKPGLSESLLPNKKSRALYRAQQERETPWLLKK